MSQPTSLSLESSSKTSKWEPGDGLVTLMFYCRMFRPQEPHFSSIWISGGTLKIHERGEENPRVWDSWTSAGVSSLGILGGSRSLSPHGNHTWLNSTQKQAWAMCICPTRHRLNQLPPKQPFKYTPGHSTATELEKRYDGGDVRAQRQWSEPGVKMACFQIFYVEPWIQVTRALRRPWKGLCSKGS